MMSFTECKKEREGMKVYDEPFFDRCSPVSSLIYSSGAQERGLGIITHRWLLKSEIC